MRRASRVPAFAARTAPAAFAACALFATVGTLVPGRACRAERTPDTLEGVRALEAKTLLPLFRAAQKADCTRQAWWLAGRLKEIDPSFSDGSAAKPILDGALELQLGNVPERTYARKRDEALAEIGEAYAGLARKAIERGAPDAETAPLVDRALSLGAKAPDLHAALEKAGKTWCGTFGAVDRKTVDDTLARLFATVSWPPEWDDEFLRARVLLGRVAVARWGVYRVVTGEAPKDAFARVSALAALDTHVVRLFGSQAKPMREGEFPYDLWVVGDAKTYDALPQPLSFRAEDERRFEGSSWWQDRWRRRALLLASDRDHPWVPAQTHFLHVAALLVLRHHVGGDAARMGGRGFAIVEGTAGVFEGLRVDPGGSPADVDPAASWRLAAGRALLSTNGRLAWDELLETDRASAEARSLAEVSATFLGERRDAKRVDAVEAQAALLAHALLTADGGKAVPRFGALLGDAIRRDRLPDVEKAMGWGKGRLAKELKRVADGG